MPQYYSSQTLGLLRLSDDPAVADAQKSELSTMSVLTQADKERIGVYNVNQYTLEKEN